MEANMAAKGRNIVVNSLNFYKITKYTIGLQNTLFYNIYSRPTKAQFIHRKFT